MYGSAAVMDLLGSGMRSKLVMMSMLGELMTLIRHLRCLKLEAIRQSLLKQVTSAQKRYTLHAGTRLENAFM
jgi:hypothetical protein